MAKQATFQPITPAYPRALTPSKRKKIAHRIDELIAVLDAADGDPDIEHDPADPPAGEGIDDDERDGTGHYGDSDDFEPELGWTGDVNQDRALRNLRLTAVQDSNHSESEHDGSEPSLGSSNFEIDQTHWTSGSNGRDLEADYVAYPDGFLPQGLQCEDEGAEHDGREPRGAPFDLVQETAP